MPHDLVHRSQRAARLEAVCPFALSLLLLLCSAPGALAQYRFDLWTTDDGLPQNSVNAILQTRDGYLWIATNDGLARYDGARFTVFDRGTQSQIGSNRMTSLYEDRHGALWIGTYEGLLVRYRDGEFFTFTPQHGLPYDEILWIEEDAQVLWLTGVKSITRWHDGRGTVYDPKDYLPGIRIGPDHRDRIKWSVEGEKLHLFSGGRVQTYTRQDGLHTFNIGTVIPDRRGNLWIPTFGDGTVKLKDGKLTAYSLNKAWWSGRPIGNISYEDQRGNLWLPDHGALLQVTGGKLTRYPSFDASAPIFYEDREGSLWIGEHHGLFRARPPVIRTLTDEAVPRDYRGLNELIYCILEDRAGTVWLGKWGGGVARYRDGRFTHYVSGQAWKATLSASKKRPDNNHSTFAVVRA